MKTFNKENFKIYSRRQIVTLLAFYVVEVLSVYHENNYTLFIGLLGVGYALMGVYKNSKDRIKNLFDTIIKDCDAKDRSSTERALAKRFGNISMILKVMFVFSNGACFSLLQGTRANIILTALSLLLVIILPLILQILLIGDLQVSEMLGRLLKRELQEP